MKLEFLVFSALVLSAAYCCAAEEPAGSGGGGKPVMRDVVRHEDIVARMRKGADPMTNLPAAEKLPEAKREAKPANLLERSDFLSFGGLCALVPKGAVLHVPECYQNRLSAEPGARIATWAEFIRRNRGWVTTLEVTREQAEGTKPFPEATLKALEKNPRVVVATLGGGPISVLAPKKPSKKGDESRAERGTPTPNQSKNNPRRP